MNASSALLLAKCGVILSQSFRKLETEMEKDEQIGANLMINQERVKLLYN